jgi:hypothetical protein
MPRQQPATTSGRTNTPAKRNIPTTAALSTELVPVFCILRVLSERRGIGRPTSLGGCPPPPPPCRRITSGLDEFLRWFGNVVTSALAARPVEMTDTIVPMMIRARYFSTVRRGRTPNVRGSWTIGGDRKSGTNLLQMHTGTIQHVTMAWRAQVSVFRSEKQQHQTGHVVEQGDTPRPVELSCGREPPEDLRSGLGADGLRGHHSKKYKQHACWRCRNLEAGCPRRGKEGPVESKDQRGPGERLDDLHRGL